MNENLIISWVGLRFQKLGSLTKEDVRSLWKSELEAMARHRGWNGEGRIYLVDETMPCGHKVSFKTFKDIPATDTPCPCGDPAHWLVKYFDITPSPKEVVKESKKKAKRKI